MKSIAINILGCIILAGTFVSCKNNSLRSSIPDRPVYFSVNIATNNKLLSPGSYIVMRNAGYGGVILVHTADNHYKAFDLCCPYEINPAIKVQPNDSISVAFATCSKCGSKYELLYGTGQPASGPSNEPLREYVATLDGNVVYVTNN